MPMHLSTIGKHVYWLRSEHALLVHYGLLGLPLFQNRLTTVHNSCPIFLQHAGRLFAKKVHLGRVGSSFHG